MAGACASAIATSAHTITSTNSATAPMNFRRRIGMVWTVAGAGESPIWSARLRQAKDHDRQRFNRRAIRLWLYAVAALVLAMVLVGGATRLTESGLSITEWRPVMGALPPMT